VSFLISVDVDFPSGVSHEKNTTPTIIVKQNNIYLIEFDTLRLYSPKLT
jgi:hypothetical protein